MTTWLTSDEHYGHKNIVEYCERPFLDVDHMREELIMCHNEVVAPGDEVWHLGDFIMDERRVADILTRLNGTHRLVVGNHDACHPRRSRHIRAREKYLAAGFKSVEVQGELEGFVLHHLPYAGDHTDVDRFVEYRPKDEGRFLAHGHCHGHFGRVHGRQIDVGVDVWDFYPVALETLMALRDSALAVKEKS
jgi:calcineurin-like phosphoesterase family protein